MGDIKTRFTLEGESQFRSAMTNAANAIKVLNAEQKLAKASFQQTGNAEKYAAQQADILKQKIANQKAAVQAAQQAIKQLTDSGVSPASRQFQQWQTKLLNAQTALTNMETELQNVNSTMQQTTDTAQGTGEAIETIGEKVSFDAVLNGIGKVTDFLESAAQKAKQFAEEIINFTREAASEADDIATTASIYNTTTQEVQQARYTADILDTSAETIMKSRQKLAKAMESESEAFKEIGVSFYQSSKTGKVMRDWEDVFWEVGDALVRIQDEKGFEYVNDQATKLFGRGWEQLRPIFASDWASEDNYLGKAFNSAREYYEAVMASWDVNSDETMKNLTKYDDSIQKLQNNLDTLKLTVAGELAPGFKEVTDFISNLVSELNKYLESDEGKEKLKDLSDAVVELFKGLTDVDFGTALDIAKGAIDGLTTGLEWIKNNWGTVKTGLEALATAFGLLKVSEGVLTFMQLLSAGKYLTGAGAAAAGGSGAVAGGGFLAGALEVAPYLALLVIAVDSIARDVSNIREMREKGKEEVEKYESDVEQFKESKYFDMWDTLSRYYTVAGTPGEDAEGIKQFAQHYKAWFDDEVTDPLMDAMVDAMTDEEYDNFHDVMERINNGEMFYGDEDVNAMRKAMLDSINVLEKLIAEETPEVPAEIVLPSDEAAALSAQIGTVLINGKVVLDDDETPHANGLPYVPYDGYRAILHKGERITTAREAQRQSYNSNLYVESMIMNNGTDAAGLAAAMAAAQRRQMSGYGS